MDRKSLKLDGTEVIDVIGLAGDIKPRQDVSLVIHRADGTVETIDVLLRIDTLDEVDYYRNGGILHYVLRNLIRAA